MVTLAIAGMLSTLAVSGISDASLAARENEAIARVEQTLVAARSLALRTNRCILVEVLNPHTLQVSEYVDATPQVCDVPPLGLTERIVSIPRKALHVSTTVEGTEGAPSVIFLPEGGTPYAGPAILTATTRVRQLTAKFEVHPRLGRVERRSP